MNSNSEIKELIKNEINRNKQIGYLKDDFFLIPVNYFPLLRPIFNFYFLIPSIFVLVFFIDYESRLNLLKTSGVAFCFVAYFLILVILMIIDLLVYNYLVFDIINEKLYIISKLFNRYVVGKTKEVKVNTIKELYIETKGDYLTGNKYYHYSDVLIALNSNNNKVIIFESTKPFFNRDIFIERSNLLAKCFDVNLTRREEQKEFRESKKRYDEEIKRDKAALPIFLIIYIIIALAIIYLSYFS